MTNLGLLKCATSFMNRFRKPSTKNHTQENNIPESGVSNFNRLDTVPKPIFPQFNVTPAVPNPRPLTNLSDDDRIKVEDLMTRRDHYYNQTDDEIISRSSPEAGYWESHIPADMISQYYGDDWKRAFNSAKQYRQDNPLTGLSRPEEFEDRLHRAVPVYRSKLDNQTTNFYSPKYNYVSAIAPGHYRSMEHLSPVALDVNGFPISGLPPTSAEAGLEHELGHSVYTDRNWINLHKERNPDEHLRDSVHSSNYPRIPGFSEYDEIENRDRFSKLPDQYENYFDGMHEFKQGLSKFKREHFNSTGHLIDSPDEFDRALKFYLSEDPETFENNIQYLTPEGQRWLRQYKRYDDAGYNTGRNAYQLQGRTIAPGLVQNRNQQMLNTSRYLS